MVMLLIFMLSNQVNAQPNECQPQATPTICLFESLKENHLKETCKSLSQSGRQEKKGKNNKVNVGALTSM